MDMSGESGIKPGMGGDVRRITKVFGVTQYEIKWDDGSSLQILSDVDKWMKEEDWERLKNRRKKVDESIDPDFARKNKNNSLYSGLLKSIPVTLETTIQRSFTPT